MSWKVKTLRMQMHNALENKFVAGLNSSRHDDKFDNSDASKIYAKKTFKVYVAHCYRFADWLKDRHPDCKMLYDARQYVDEYLKFLIDSALSASTVKSYACALAKLYDCHLSDFIKTPPRHRSEIERSRNAVRYDRHFSTENPENQKLISFCRSTGLRRNELEHLRGDFLIEKDGRYFLDFTKTDDPRGNRANFCKGGRPRLVPVIGDIDLVVSMCKNAGPRLVFPVVHHACDVHHLRSEYAAAFYDAEFAREYPDGIESVPPSDRYYCRNDYVGRVMSRKCMAVVSEALGHSRIQVISSSYLYN